MILIFLVKGSRLKCMQDGVGKWNIVRENEDGSVEQVPQTLIGPRSSKELLDHFQDYSDIIGDAAFKELVGLVHQTVSIAPPFNNLDLNACTADAAVRSGGGCYTEACCVLSSQRRCQPMLSFCGICFQYQCVLYSTPRQAGL